MRLSYRSSPSSHKSQIPQPVAQNRLPFHNGKGSRHGEAQDSLINPLSASQFAIFILHFSICDSLSPFSIPSSNPMTQSLNDSIPESPSHFPGVYPVIAPGLELAGTRRPGPYDPYWAVHQLSERPCHPRIVSGICSLKSLKAPE